MVFCRTSGFEWSEVYNWNVDEFKEVYHALQRNDARANLRQFATVSQAFGGDKKSVKEFVDQESQWLPAHERNGGAGNEDDFISVLRKGVKLKEG